LNVAEKASLLDKAAANHVGLSTYIKQVSLGYEITQKPVIIYRKSDPTLIRQVACAGNNLNQIAYVMNSGKVFTASERFTVALLLEDISNQLKEIQDGNV